MKKYNQKIIDLIQELSKERKEQNKYGTREPIYLIQRKTRTSNWETVAYFLTERDAKNYQNYQGHNLGMSRLYIISPGYDNRGILAQLLEILDTEDFILEAE